MRIDVQASAPHYADHLSAVFDALPDDARGSFVALNAPTAVRIAKLGYETSKRGEPSRPVLVASYGDLKRAEYAQRTRIAIMEHGAGQSYGGRPTSGRHGSYAGGQNRGAASLFLHPGGHPAERDRRAYQNARVEVVGSPFLDTLPAREGPPGRVVAFSTHFNATIAPEAKGAWGWIWPSVIRLAREFTVLGHSHPRMFDRVRRLYHMNGIEPVREFTDVCRRADVYVCDNSSTLYAFAATGRPVVVLNPPWYDRRVDHGLRFWDAADVGVQCNDPADLARCIDEALEDRPAQRRAREAALDLVYAYRTGASQRAADALMEWVA